eukprot:TRINITY_DN9811_c0_g1_i1.p1 TRINITY_DN9811_c0_g1~~TRINITY_DN9811_c0_g1_i1.p1  ORF type:complete len:364 (+),score=76.27 TRINITY_DN9811_c0_g1_i1:99-1190(+)
METWRSTSGGKLENEAKISQLEKVKLYDGDGKTLDTDGTIELTTHRLIWSKGDGHLSLPLSLIKSSTYEEGSFMRSDKIYLKLSNGAATRIGGKSGVDQLNQLIVQTVREEKWVVKPAVRMPAKKEIRSGIAGIEKKLQQKAASDSKNISKAFQDLDRLIEMAKPMVALSKSISNKIREKQGDITEDETIQFKSYLLSLGVDDPVTKDSAGSDKKYYQGLAKEMFLVLDQPIQDAGGMMTLTDAYVRVNRARGLALVSPEDLLHACKMLKELNLPLTVQTFDSGVIVLKSSNITEEEYIEKIVYLTEAFEKISADQLAKELKLSVLLAGERLQSAANNGHILVDQSIHGLTYYPNKFDTLILE